MRKIILDVDTGIDDALGILLAVKGGVADIAAITTVSGNVSLQKATNNTCKILELIGAQDIPVVQGAFCPLMREPRFEHDVHGVDGLGGALKEMTPSNKPAEGFAPDFIIRTVKENPGSMTLIMTGPLTNLALALRKCAELPELVDEVVFMGGVVNARGNITPVAEFNMYVDPEAARIVFQAGFKKLTMVGLDVTSKVLFTDDHIAQLTNPTIKNYVSVSLNDYMDRYARRHEGIRASLLHDPLAVGVALYSGLVTTKAYHVDIETRSELCDGQTVCDFNDRLLKPANMNVCVEVDSEAFLQLFIETLNR